MNETTGARFVRGLVKAVFVGCYAAFMWASIHHVAAFFDNFEQNGASDTFGSYLLAGAIDITALVTTIGVMFFRKSMPRNIQGILWAFIVGLAIYSFFINWEYASHYQNTSLILQPTGATTPVYDNQGQLHYVPVMVENTWLLYVNPALASCFTIFALIYSVVGEFFGAKAPTAAELAEKLSYLKSINGTQEEIRKLEEKSKKPGLIQRGKAAALEIKTAVKEVRSESETSEERPQETPENREPITDKLAKIAPGNSAGNATGKPQENQGNRIRKVELTPEEALVESVYEKASSWLSDGRSTVSLKVASETMNVPMKTLNNRVANHKIRRTKGEGIVYKDSLVSWVVAELIPKENRAKPVLKLVGNEEDSPVESEEEATPNKLQMAIDFLIENGMDVTDESLAEHLHLLRPASALFWRRKAIEVLKANPSQTSATM